MPLLHGQTNASRLAEQVRNDLALKEGIFGRVTVALELIEVYEANSDSKQAGAAYYLASVCFPDRPALDQVKGSFVKHQLD